MTEEQDAHKKSGRRKFLTWAGIGGAIVAAGGLLFRHVSATSAVTVESHMSDGNGRKKNILVLTGSGRKGGNSSLLAEAFASGAREAGHTVHLFPSAQEPMQACQHCEGCWSTGSPCVIHDSFDKLFPLLEEAELLVLCSPLYWYAMSGHIKCAIDRMYPYSKQNRKRDLKIRECMLLMCGESHFLRSFAGPAESYRQMLGYKGWKDRGCLYVTGVNALGDIAKTKALDQAREMGLKA